MGTRDPRVDAYIAKSADFARPILTTIRDTVHAACPDVVEEMKWVSDLPAKKAFVASIKKAMALNDEGVKVERRPPRRATVDTTPPADLAAALKKDKKANAAFNAFPPSHKREYIEWITEAKGADTRARRLKSAVEWMAEGKARNWKYERK